MGRTKQQQQGIGYKRRFRCCDSKRQKWCTTVSMAEKKNGTDKISAVQPCQHSPHVTTRHLNVATDNC